jgi:hypothetical protein
LPPRSAAGASTSGGLLNPPAARPANIQPLPDPSAGPAEAPAHDPPRLLDPRDKTAMAPRWVVVPISWPAPEARVERLPVQAETSAPPVFDDRGWRSVHSN